MYKELTIARVTQNIISCYSRNVPLDVESHWKYIIFVLLPFGIWIFIQCCKDDLTSSNAYKLKKYQLFIFLFHQITSYNCYYFACIYDVLGTIQMGGEKDPSLCTGCTALLSKLCSLPRWWYPSQRRQCKEEFSSVVLYVHNIRRNLPHNIINITLLLTETILDKIPYFITHQILLYDFYCLLVTSYLPSGCLVDI